MGSYEDVAEDKAEEVRPAPRSKVMVLSIALGEIELDQAIQQRADGVNQGVIEDYAEAMKAGEQFPPVIVFLDCDKKKKWLADGFHRVPAAGLAGLVEIRAEIRPGTRRDALLYAVAANGTHGLRRTHADKRHAVATLLKDKEWRRWSNREIARHCGVHHKLVGEIKKSLELNASEKRERVYTNKHGQKAVMKIGKLAERANVETGAQPDDQSEEPEKDAEDRVTEGEGKAVAADSVSRPPPLIRSELSERAEVLRDAVWQYDNTYTRMVELVTREESGEEHGEGKYVAIYHLFDDDADPDDEENEGYVLVFLNRPEPDVTDFQVLHATSLDDLHEIHSGYIDSHFDRIVAEALAEAMGRAAAVPKGEDVPAADPSPPSPVAPANGPSPPAPTAPESPSVDW